MRIRSHNVSVYVEIVQFALHYQFSDMNSMCLPGYSCYKVMPELGQVTRVKADERCNMYGGHLASMGTEPEYRMVTSWLKNLQYGKTYNNLLQMWHSMLIIC